MYNMTRLEAIASTSSAAVEAAEAANAVWIGGEKGLVWYEAYINPVAILYKQKEEDVIRVGDDGLDTLDWIPEGYDVR